MGLFGSSRPLATDVAWMKAKNDAFNAGQTEDAAPLYMDKNAPTGLTGMQKLALLGATLKDVGAGLGGGESDDVASTQAGFQRQAALAMSAAQQGALRKGLFGGSAPASAVAPLPGRVDPVTLKPDAAPAAAPAQPRSLRSMSAILGPAIMAGVPGAKEMVDLLDKSGPDIQVVNGVAYDKRGTSAGQRIGANLTNVNGTMVDTQDQANANRFVPEAPAKGATLVYDAKGNPAGWQMMNGSIQAIQATSAAEAAGKGAGEAPYSLETVTGPDGSPITAARSEFLKAPVIGQSPDQASAAKNLADAAAERQTIQPKQRAAVDAQARTTDLVLAKILEARDLANGATTGLGSLAAGIPGTKAKDLATVLDTIRANVGFDKLAEMRANSPTGGALGSISEKENTLLQSVLGSLDQGQSTEQMLANFDRIGRELTAAKNERQSTYNRIYSKPPPQTRASGPPARKAPAGYSVVTVRRAGQ